ncbi:MAG: hypothetical protein AMXMBFR84_47330 [Candidatus Hydrogenedentota bacterium]
MRTLDSIEKKPPTLAIGSAKTVVVSGKDNEAVAVIAKVNAQIINEYSGELFRSSGPGTVCPAAIRHYVDVLTPNLSSKYISKFRTAKFTLSVSNVSISAAQNRKLELNGYSADAAVCMACLSSALGIPCRSDVVFSAHVSDPNGTCAVVDSLPAKLRAVCEDPYVGTFVCADPRQDPSLRKLARDDYDAIEEALRRASARVEVIFVEDLSDVVRIAFRERDLVISSLLNLYFDEACGQRTGSELEKSLFDNLHGRFWSALEREWLDGDPASASELLAELVRYFAGRGSYAHGAGENLYRILVTLPPYIRKRLQFPLLPGTELARLIAWARPDDVDDIRYFLNANAGDRLPELPPAVVTRAAGGDAPDENPDLKALLATIDPDVIRRDVIEPIESAMATYRLDGAVVGSDESYLSVPANCYLHLLRHTHEVKDVRSNAVEDEATALLARAFAHTGGLRAAQAEARSGAPHGGIRYVLERMGRQYAAEQEHMYVQHAIESHLQQLSYERRVALVAALIDRFRPYLTETELDTAPEQFLKNPEPLVRAYMQTAASLRSVFRAL